MNMPLFSHGMQHIIIGFCFCLVFAGSAVYVAKYRFKKPGSRKWRVILAICLVCLLSAYFVFYTVSNLIGRAQVESRLERMKSHGIPITPETILPRPPKDRSKNGAYFYNAAFNLMDANASWEKLYDMIVDNEYDVANWPEVEVKKAKQLLDNKDINLALSLFSRGAAKSCAVYEREFRGMDTRLPELRSYRTMFRLIALKSSCYGIDDKADAGYELIRDGYKSLAQLLNEPYLISQLVNVACTSLNIDAMNALVAKHGISNASAEELIGLLDRLDFNRALKRGIDGDVVICIQDCFDKIMRGQYFSGEISQMFGSEVPFFSVLTTIWPFSYQDFAYALDRTSKLTTLFDKPYWEIKSELDSWMEQHRHFMIIAESITSSFGPVRIKAVRIKTEINAAKLMLALHIFKNQNGHFPEKLKELSPGILKQLPVDPISGKPFEYKKQKDSFMLDSAWLKEKRSERQN